MLAPLALFRFARAWFQKCLVQAVFRQLFFQSVAGNQGRRSQQSYLALVG